MKRNDTLWKGILESVCDDFLKFFFEEADALFSMEKGFQFLDKELDQLFPADNIAAPKFVDKLIKVFTKSGEEEWILIHIEVQGYKDENFGKRMFTYFYRILDRYDKPVTAIAIFTDNNENYHPAFYQYEYLGTKTTFQFNTYKILDQEEEVLSKSDNPFSIVVLTVLIALQRKKLTDEKLYNLKYSLARNLLERKIDKKKIDDLLIFLQHYVTFADPEYNAKFEKEIEELSENRITMGIRELVLDQAKKEGMALGKKEGIQKGIQKGIKEGIQKGIKEGLQKGKTQVVKNMLAAGRFTDKEIANFAGVTEVFVQTVRKTI